MSDAGGCRGAILTEAVRGFFEQIFIPIMHSSALGFQATYCSQNKATDSGNVAENLSMVSKLLS